jgi:hypothetical protein
MSLSIEMAFLLESFLFSSLRCQVVSKQNTKFTLQRSSGEEYLWRYVIPGVGNLTEEKFPVCVCATSSQLWQLSYVETSSSNLLMLV